MSDYLPFLVSGLTNGSVYALAATGLVLTFRISRILNFAYGSIAAVTVLLFFALVDRMEVPWGIAVALTVLVIGPIAGVLFSGLGRRLGSLSTEAKVLATVGLIPLLTGVVILWGANAYGTHPTARPSLPGSLVRIGGVNVGVDQIMIVVVGLVTTGILHFALEHTATGRSMRAVVDNPELLGLTGRNPNTVRRTGWALGIGFVTLAGILLVLSPNNFAPVQNLNLLVLQALGAAAIGGFSSLPLAYAGGLMLGVISALTTKFVVDIPILGGLPGGIPFIVLFVMLAVVPGHFARASDTKVQPPQRRIIEIPRMWRAVPVVVVAVALVSVGLSNNVHLIYTANEGLSYAVLFLGLSLLVRTSQQVSLCQIGLAAVGSGACAHLAGGFGVPWLAAVLIGALAAAAVGAVVAIPAIRVAGIYVAVATFGFGALLQEFAYPTRLLFGATGGTQVQRPSIWGVNAGDDLTYFVMLVVIFALAAACILGLRRARLGRLLRALADSPTALEAQGASIDTTRVVVFAISAFFAGLGGALLVSQLGFLLATPFDSMNSLTVFVVLMGIRVAEPAASLVAATAFVVVPSFLSPKGSVWWLDLGFGALAVIAALTEAEPWMPRWRWAPSPRAQPTSPRRPGPQARAVPSWGRPGDGLAVEHLTVHFKGTVAVNDLTLRVPRGRITGLIGPNGAGKTTTFDFCSGLVRGRSGRVILNGHDITSLGPSSRARRGLGRTFQRSNLFESMTVRQNIELGAESAMAAANPLTQVVASRRQMAATQGAAIEAIRLVGIEALSDREVTSLSTGQKRLVEIARCLAGNFDVLLLDEPASGLDAQETERIGEVLLRVLEERQLAILVVEHDMTLVTQVCSYIYVLDFGQLIGEGAVTEVMASATVRSAYLGSESTRLPG